MPSLIDDIRKRAAARSRRVVYTEAADRRVVEAAEEVSRAGIAIPIFLGDSIRSRSKPLPPHRTIKVVDVTAVDRYVRLLGEDYRPHGFGETEIRDGLRSPALYANAMVRSGDADAVMLGPGSSARIFRTLTSSRREQWHFHLLERSSDVPSPALLFAHSVAPDAPSPSELAQIGMRAAQLARTLLPTSPRLAFLAPEVVVDLRRHSRFYSAHVRQERRVREAIATVEARAPDLGIDSDWGGDLLGWGDGSGPNTYVFVDPQLETFHFQLREFFPGSRVLGPIFEGMAVSTGCVGTDCTVDDIVDTTAIIALARIDQKV